MASFLAISLILKIHKMFLLFSSSNWVETDFLEVRNALLSLQWGQVFVNETTTASCVMKATFKKDGKKKNKEGHKERISSM